MPSNWCSSYSLKSYEGKQLPWCCRRLVKPWRISCCFKTLETTHATDSHPGSPPGTTPDPNYSTAQEWPKLAEQNRLVEQTPSRRPQPMPGGYGPLSGSMGATKPLLPECGTLSKHPLPMGYEAVAPAWQWWNSYLTSHPERGPT